jgi:hypothetical protein
MNQHLVASIVLRFRDLVTEAGETIAEHQSIIRTYRATWWGWMGRKREPAPRHFLGENVNVIERDGRVPAYVFDSDLLKLYLCELTAIAVAPSGTRIGSPEPERTPEYYNRGRYPAWFLFGNIKEIPFPVMYYDSFPTAPEQLGLTGLINTQVPDEGHLRDVPVTLWAVRIGSIRS